MAMNISEIRSLFPVVRECVFLNHAAVSPLSTRAADAIRRHVRDVEQFGNAHSAQWDQMAETARHAAARLINANADEIAFVKNTTEGISFVANGLRWQPGDNVVTTNVEFPANVYPWLNLRDRGVEVRMVPEIDGRIPPQRIEEAIDGKTRVVALSFVEFLSGFRHDLERLGAAAKRHGALFVIDAIQGLGAIRLDVKQCQIDFLSADAHKWLLGPEGIGVFYAAQDSLEKIDVVEAGWMSVVDRSNYLDYNLCFPPNARRFECGTYNAMGIAGLGAAIELLLEVGLASVESRVLQITEGFCLGLERKGAQVFSSRAENERSGIVTFRHPRRPSKEVWQRLRDANVIAAMRSDMVRVSPHFYNTEDEIERALDAIG